MGDDTGDPSGGNDANAAARPGAFERAERALRESEALKTAMLEASPDAVISIDHRGHVLEWNPAAALTFGFPREAAMGTELAELIVPLRLRADHRAGLTRYLATGEGPVLGKRIELPALRADGSEFPAELTITRIALDGPPTFTAFVRDITQRQQIAEEMMDIADELQRKNREKQEFFAILAHDLKHPVISIQGLLSLLKTDVYEKLDDESKDHLRLSLSECERMRDMLGRINELGKIDFMTPRHEAVQFDAFVKSCADRFRPRAETLNLTIQVEAPATAVRISRWHLEQALSNLIENALNYGCPPGTCRIEVTAEVEGLRGRITVRDFGPGIDPRHHQRIFEPFRRLSPTAGPAGSGIGLTAVRQLMTKIEGNVSLESTLGEGARFTLTFPA